VTANPATFRAAAQLIRDKGLAKGTFGVTPDSPHCTVGALRTVNPGVSYWVDDNEDLRVLGGLLGLNGEFLWADIALWNDREETTEQDVITLLEQAAEKLEADR
jgi:hypothetical protein